MLITLKRGQGSVILRVKLLNSASPSGAGLTGLVFNSAGLIISTIADTEATATVYTTAGSSIETITTLGTFATPTTNKCRFKEIDAINHPGWYEIQLINSRFSVSNAKYLTLSIHGATNLQQADYLIQLQADDPQVSKPTNFELLDIEAGSGRVDVGYIAGAAQTSTDIGAFTSSLWALGPDIIANSDPSVLELTGQGGWTPDDMFNGCLISVVDVSVGAMASRWIVKWIGSTGIAILDSPLPFTPQSGVDKSYIYAFRQPQLGVIRQGTCQTDGAPDSTHAVLDAGASAVDDQYNGLWFKIVAGTGLGQEPRAITDYVGSTKRVTLDPPLVTVADNTTEFAIFA